LNVSDHVRNLRAQPGNVLERIHCQMEPETAIKDALALK
jgi:hypothetical protein